MLNKKRHNEVENDETRMATSKDIEDVYSNKFHSKKTVNVNNKNSSANFNKLFFITAFLVILFSFLASFFIKKSFVILDAQNISYQENSSIDYNVFLKENDFYEGESLPKDMSYVASLIDKIDVNFLYNFKIDKRSNIDFEYDIVGNLIISDSSSDKVFFEKKYVLLDNTTDNMVDDGSHKIEKNVSINYGEYNSIANQFRSKYGIDVSSKLIVYLNIHEKSKDGSYLRNSSSMSISIPLSERAVNISMDYNEINKSNRLVRDEQFVITNYFFVVLGLIFVVLFICTCINFFKLIFHVRIRKSKYDKYVAKLLREYDRLIVETITKPNLDDKNIIVVLKFQELLDVRDNLKLPIKYYVVESHSECYFYINYRDEVYLFHVKDKDFCGK